MGFSGLEERRILNTFKILKELKYGIGMALGSFTLELPN